MKTLFLGVALMTALSGQAGATTRLSKTDSRKLGLQPPVSQPYCEVRAVYEGAALMPQQTKPREDRVYWKLRVLRAQSFNQGECPALSVMRLAIRGAELKPRNQWRGSESRYMYPVHIVPPALSAEVTAFVRKTHVDNSFTRASYDEWLVTDWDDGFHVEP